MQTQVNTIFEGVTLYPSEEEFNDFRSFINSLESRPELQNQGIVKVFLTRSFHQPVSMQDLETSNEKFNNQLLFDHLNKKSMVIKVLIIRCL